MHDLFFSAISKLEGIALDRRSVQGIITQDFDIGCIEFFYGWWVSWDKPFENAKIWHRMILNCDLKEIIFIMKKIILLHISDAFHFSNILVTSK